jgi:hypothetical protein
MGGAYALNSPTIMASYGPTLATTSYTIPSLPPPHDYTVVSSWEDRPMPPHLALNLAATIPPRR